MYERELLRFCSGGLLILFCLLGKEMLVFIQSKCHSRWIITVSLYSYMEEANTETGRVASRFDEAMFVVIEEVSPWESVLYCKRAKFRISIIFCSIWYALRAPTITTFVVRGKLLLLFSQSRHSAKEEVSSEDWIVISESFVFIGIIMCFCYKICSN